MRFYKKPVGLVIVLYLFLLLPLAAAAEDLSAAVKLEIPDYLYTNTVNAITVKISGDAGNFSGKYLGLYVDQGLLDKKQLDAGAPTYQFTLQALKLGKHQLRAVLANDRDLTEVVSEDVQERTAIINGYAANSSMLPFTSGEVSKGDFLFTPGDSRYSGMVEYGDVYAAHYTPELPAGAVVKQARLFASWTWSNWRNKGVEPQMQLSLNNQPLIPDRQYSDRKGWGVYDYPSGTRTYNVTKLIAEKGLYTVELKNTNPENHFAVNGIGLLVIYEDAMSEKAPLKYWINEGCDIVWSSEVSHASPEEATTWTSFSQAPAPEQVASATLLTIIPSGDKGKNALLFNKGIYYGLWDGKPYSDFSFNLQDVTRAVKEGKNEVGFQDRTDYMVPSGVVLLVRMMTGTAGGAGNTPGDSAGTAGTGGSAGGSTGDGSPAGDITDRENQEAARVEDSGEHVKGRVMIKVGSEGLSSFINEKGLSGSTGLYKADRLSAVLMAITMLTALIVGFRTERTRLIR